MMHRAVVLLTLTLAAVAPASASASTYVYSLSVGLQVKPSEPAIANHTTFRGLRWSKWGASKAVARGRARTVYPGGSPTTGTVTLRLSAPKQLCGRTLFTKAHWTYRGGKGSYTSYFNAFDDASSDCGYWNGA